MIDEQHVESLVSQGRHVEAARLCAEGGQPARAAELLAIVWKFAEAMAIAKEAGLFDEAYRHAVQANEPSLATQLIAELAARPDQAARAAVHAEAKGRHSDAARLLEAAGAWAEAAALHERAGDLVDAARCRRDSGDFRGAGRLYEQRLREAPDDASSALELGQILMRFGRWEHAVRALQIAANDRALAFPAGRLLIAAFDALGMGDAAQSRLDALRGSDPGLPHTVPAMLEAAFGDPRGPRYANAEHLLIGRYRVIRTLGAGGTGRVILAEDAFYGREVAIKVLHAGASGAAGRDALTRFAREARVAAGVEHPNVIKIHEYHPEGPFLVMEFMSGGTLEDRFSQADQEGRPLDPGVVRHILHSISSALEAVHRRGVVHRDLKPANVFFGPAGEIKIGDFGVAHLADVGATLTGAMIGTLAFMAPEQITGTSNPDPRTDLYALGVILYRALTGLLPFPGPDYVTQHLEHVPPTPSSFSPWLHAGFDSLVARLLAKDMTARPKSATEVLEQITQLAWDSIDPQRFTAVASPRSVARSEPPPAVLDIDRWKIVETQPDGRCVAEDTVLGRRVAIVPCDGGVLDRARAFARADSPYLQAIWSIDEANDRAIVELPAGIRPGPNDTVSSEAIECLRLAIDSIHRAGMVHGAIDREHIVLGEGRAVLLLPKRFENLAATPEDDLRALQRVGHATAS